jgi:hypothetical protein
VYFQRSVLSRFKFSYFILLTIFLSNTFLVQANNGCDQKLPEAETEYLAGYYDVAIQLLAECLAQDDFSDDDRKIEAYSILARAYMAGDYPIEKTKAAIYKIQSCHL